VKFDFLQGDFSAGELSPRAQGHADSAAYKAGLKLAANVAPTRTGSLASRAGLELYAEGIDGNTGVASNLPVQHIPIHDGPYGDFMLEVSPTGIRLMDKDGVAPWNFPPTSEWLQFTQQDGSFSFADAETRTIYLRSDVATGVRSYYVTKAPAAGVDAHNALLLGVIATWATKPVGTNENWIFSGKISGDGVTAHIEQSNAANFQDIAIAPDASGNFSIAFRPNIGGVDQDFFIQLKSGAGTTSTVMWGLRLVKHAAKMVQDTTAVIIPGTFGGVKTAPVPDRVRAAAFWTQGDFWIALAGGGGSNPLGADNNPYAGFALRWTPSPAAFPSLSQWTFGTLPCTTSSLARVAGANAVVVFQDRLWYGINLKNGKRCVRASRIGYGQFWGYAAQAGSTGTPQSVAHDFLFQFVVEVEGAIPAPGVRNIDYKFPAATPKSDLLVWVGPTPNFIKELRTESVDWTIAGHTFDYEAAPDGGFKIKDQTLFPGGTISFNPAGGTGFNDGDAVYITHVATALDPLDLNLASPNGKIAWLNILRGLMLGTTRNEKLFTDGVLAIDPATGQNFDLRDESSLGADPVLPALEVNDRVLFAQRGRKMLRLAGISITTDGGLVSDDVGVAGEHLTKARIRSMCFLKSPVQRVVFAFDDGTGAVMSLVGKNAAFSRLSVPACFGGLYNVAALDGDLDSELWVGTENGVTLRARSFESDIVVRQVALQNAAPAAPTHLVYAADNPLPPVMDSWVRAPLVNQGGAQYVVGLPACAVGQNAYVFTNGQVRGPYAVVAGGKVVLPADLLLGVTWVDLTGARRAQEIYVGLLYPEHRFTSLPLEGGNAVGTSQNLQSRKPQLYLRLVDSYLPLVKGKRLAERGPADPTDVLAARVTADRRASEEGFQRGAVVDVVMDLPLRMEISAIFGGVVMNNL
jgi:hypothetical protein